jgi:hypothetical protein
MLRLFKSRYKLHSLQHGRIEYIPFSPFSRNVTGCSKLKSIGGCLFVPYDLVYGRSGCSGGVILSKSTGSSNDMLGTKDLFCKTAKIIGDDMAGLYCLLTTDRQPIVEVIRIVYPLPQWQFSE